MNNLPDRVNEVLSQYFSVLNPQLPDIFEGFYLTGSISLGAFSKGFSDIDFVAVTKRNLSDGDITILKQIHKLMKKKFRDTDLDGLYIPSAYLDGGANETRECLKFLDGKSHWKTFDLNSIDAYQLKRYSIPILGPQPGSFNYEVNWDILLAGMQKNLNTYWCNWRNSCDRLFSMRFPASFFSLSLLEWGVTGVSRLYYTFQEKDITSKIGAAEYALQTVPAEWHMIIKEVMRLRSEIPNSYYKSIFQRRKDALGYIEFIINESNRIFSLYDYRRKVKNRRCINIANLDEQEIGNIVSTLSQNEELAFFDYFHPQWSDPGAYVTVCRYGDEYIYKLGNHGWGSNWQYIDLQRITRYIFKNRNHQDVDTFFIMETVNEPDISQFSVETFWEDKLSLTYRDTNCSIYEVNGYHLIHLNKTNETYALVEEEEEMLAQGQEAIASLYQDYFNIKSDKKVRVLWRKK